MFLFFVFWFSVFGFWFLANSSSTACPDDPALAGTYQHTFGGAAPDFTTTAGSDVIKFGGPDGAIFRVEKRLDAPTIVSNFYIMWGRLDITLKAAPGGGIVSSVVLQSDDLDELDWEWVGSRTNEAQSNYFGKGNTGSYDRGAVHPVDALKFHTYSLDWTVESTEWLIDGTVVRTLKPADVKGDFYPQTPMQVRLGAWGAGDKDNEQGTIRWSGGPIDYSKAPFDMVVKDIKVVDYSTGTAYRYTDQTGRWQSIEAVGGKVGAGPQVGKGNQGNLTSADEPGSSSTSTGTPKTGLLIPTTSDASAKPPHSTSKPSPSPDDAESDAPADSTESTPSPTSPPSGSSTAPGSGFGKSPSRSYGANRPTSSTGIFTGTANKLGSQRAATLVGLAAMVMGWLL